MESPLVPNAMSAIVVKILSVPVGSADAERAFSTFFHIRDKHRTGLTTEHLEAYIRRHRQPKKLTKVGQFVVNTILNRRLFIDGGSAVTRYGANLTYNFCVVNL